jgi:hypothetical protein
MDFVSSLRPEHLQSFWYSASSYNFALVGTFISLLWATAIDSHEADVYKKCLDEYRWVLRLSSKSADFLQRAIGMLSVSTGVLVRRIPETLDREWVLGRHLRTRRYDVRVSDGLVRQDSHGASVAGPSESEKRDDTESENVSGDTPPDTDLLAGVWDMDHAWFSTLGEVRSGFEEGYGDANMSNANLDLSIAQVDFDHGQYL